MPPPCLSIRTLHTYLRTYVCPNNVRSPSQILFIKFYEIGHIVKYHDVYFKFNNGPYPGPLVEPLKPLETFNLVEIL